MAGFRIGRGRDPRDGRRGDPAQQPANGGPHSPYGGQGQYGQHVPYAQHPTQPGPGGPPPTHPGQPPYQGGYGPGAPTAHGGPTGGPDAYGHRGAHGAQGPHGGPWQQSDEDGPEYFDGRYDSRHQANSPGHTQMFRVDEQGYPGDDEYSGGATYAAGRSAAPPAAPKLHWKQLLTGIVLRPNATFWQMRDHSVWGPAVLVTFLYGLLAVFGLDKAREDVLNSTLGSAVPYVLITGVAVVLSGLVLGSVTHTLARQFGGDGAWGPTVGMAMLISSITDAPRLLFALFLGGTATFVQILGWATWIAAGFLFTSMVSRSHDLPWQKALGASAIQLLSLLVLIKLGTL
ncbi:YIP1 family protein [Streptomyces durbertensis]|uniref:YIP1 family protein n=1 Tax=Streptomyces durbertensis TaxID=2448886 RepID=A0ABR6EMH4_9ACTN|nr:YIP1 family protein [Streptomyces durbertensis]MBB1246544.1 YIP1 family protein [Streptomyces durbertensis]